MGETLQIRPATEADIPLLLEFIRELAEYERLADQVVASEELLRKNLFGERPAAESLLGFYQTQPAAFALFFHNFSTFLARPGLYLEDLFVKPQFRGRGFGKQLLRKLAQLAAERDCGRLEWSVLDWNEPAIGFYRAIGARPLDDWTVFRLNGEPLRALGASSRKA
jgi:ribosomal protein S18 acetylase RimI-like enzyme